MAKPLITHFIFKPRLRSVCVAYLFSKQGLRGSYHEQVAIRLGLQMAAVAAIERVLAHDRRPKPDVTWRLPRLLKRGICLV
jgi:hypothetical protein